MFARIESLGERLLTRLVPRATAHASYYCWWEGCGSTPCLTRTCCHIPARGTVCYGCNYNC